MAAITVKIIDGKYENEDAVENVVRYIMRLKNPLLVGGYGVSPLYEDCIIEQFNDTKNYYGKNHGRKLIHIMFSVDRTLRFDVMDMKRLGDMLGEYFGKERQVIYAVHNDVEHMHIHMCVNTVSFIDGTYKDFFDIYELKAYAKKCLSIIIDTRWFNKQRA